jgi:hypothetical protein
MQRGLGTHATNWHALIPLTDWRALTCAVCAVALPTVSRAALNGVVTGCEFTPYLPFVLIAAILLRWWQAGLVALAAVAIMGGLFEGSLLHPMPCFVPAAGMFVASSAIMIVIAILARRLVMAFQNRGADESTRGIVFSLDKGHVWASWYGQSAPVRLGTRREVSYMMEDFLAQEQLAKRLAENGTSAP